MSAALLSVEGLRVGFHAADGSAVEAVRGVDLTVAPGEAVGLVGESGSGKSLTALSLMRLVQPPVRILGGRVMFEGRDVLALPPPELRRLRGAGIAMVFQDPQGSLNPAVTIGRQIVDAVRAHRRVDTAEARRVAADVLDRVGISRARERLDAYPHEFSGGMRQRAMIAMAIACRPKLLIADEPTTALDVTVQAQIVNLLAELRRDLGLAILFISHNLDLVAEIVDRVCVMYGGKLVEEGPVEAVFAAGRHPYTRLLEACVPRLDDDPALLSGIEGAPPRLGHMPPGCPFEPRCPRALSPCPERMPPLEVVARPGGGRVACFNPC